MLGRFAASDRVGRGLASATGEHSQVVELRGRGLRLHWQRIGVHVELREREADRVARGEPRGGDARAGATELSVEVAQVCDLGLGRDGLVPERRVTRPGQRVL